MGESSLRAISMPPASCPSIPALERFILSFSHVSQKPTIIIGHSLMEHVSFERLSGSLKSMVYGIILLTVYIFIYITVYIFAHIYIYIYIHTRVYIYTHIYKSREQLHNTLKFKR